MRSLKQPLLVLALALPVSQVCAGNVQVAPVAPVSGIAGLAPAAGAAAISGLRLGSLSLGAPSLSPSLGLTPTLAPLAGITPSLVAPAAVVVSKVSPFAVSPAVVGAPSLSLPKSVPTAASVYQASPLSASPVVAGAPSLSLPKSLSGAVSKATPVSKVAAAATPAAAPETLRERLTAAAAQVREAAAAPSGLGAKTSLDRMFLGDRQRAAAAVDAAGASVVNDDGINIFGRAPAYYQEVKRLVAKLGGRLDLGESLDVMGDSYGDVWAKLKAIEAVARRLNVKQHNTHLEQTLMWVDGVMNDRGRSVAVNTYRVYFHRSDNPRSEIEEGIRRVDKYLEEAGSYFARKGKAERAMGRFDEVLLVFDTRGYAEIKEHLQDRERQFSRRLGRRFRFAYLDEMTRTPESEAGMREELNRLIARYEKDEGLNKIIEGVIYGRYVGLLGELKSIEDRLENGYEIVQSGHELFDAQRKYVTELDVVVRNRATGSVGVVEAKSARVPLPFRQVLRDKVEAKLETYAKHRAVLEKDIGSKVDEVVFSFDVGSNTGLIDYLRSREKSLSEKYGFKVSFLFLHFSPEEVGVAKTKKRE